MSSIREKKQILFIAPQPFYEDRGTPIAVKDTLETLSKLGYSVDVATYPQGTDVTFPGIFLYRTSNPFKFKRVPVGLSLRKVLLDLCLLITTLRLAMANHYDCVHGVEEGAAIALVVKVFFRWPVIYDMQSSLPEQLRSTKGLNRGAGQRLCLKFERWLIKNANCIIASKGLALRVLTIDHKKKVVECNFSSCCTYNFHGDLVGFSTVPKPPTLLYAGNFAPYQDLEHLLLAVVKVRADIPDVILLMVGGTATEISRLTKVVRNLKIEDHIQLIARQPRAEIPKYIERADALVLPRTRGENAPLKLFDYMKSGKPIIATDIPAHRALLSKKTAILVKSQTNALAKGIITALRNPILAQNLAQAALSAAQVNEAETLSEVIDEVYRETTSLYEETISQRKAHF